eukprot:884391-Pleurochrysis_carterae.AAC.1
MEFVEYYLGVIPETPGLKKVYIVLRDRYCAAYGHVSFAHRARCRRLPGLAQPIKTPSHRHGEGAKGGGHWR